MNGKTKNMIFAINMIGINVIINNDFSKDSNSTLFSSIEKINVKLEK